MLPRKYVCFVGYNTGNIYDGNLTKERIFHLNISKQHKSPFACGIFLIKEKQSNLKQSSSLALNTTILCPDILNIYIELCVR